MQHVFFVYLFFNFENILQRYSYKFKKTLGYNVAKPEILHHHCKIRHMHL